MYVFAISIVIDLTWVAAIFTTTDGVNPGTLRAARVAKLGAKAGRLAKLTKMFKFLSFGKKDEKEDDVTPAKKQFLIMAERVAKTSGVSLTPEAIASGFLKIAVEKLLI